MFNTLLTYDRDLFLSLQSLIPSTYANLIHITGELVVLAGGMLLIALWLIGVRHHDDEYKKNALRIFCGIIGVFVLYSIINLGLPQWRPGAMELSGATALIPHPTDNSFPSGHALFSAALLVGLWNFYRKSWLLITFALIAIITTSARVIGGVHYPGDILGGFFFGSIGAMLLLPLTTSDFMEKKIYPFAIRIAGWIKL